MSIAIICMATTCLPVKSETLMKFPFRVTVDKMQFMFQEVSGLDAQQKPTDSSKSPRPTMPGIKKMGQVTVSKGIISNNKISAAYLSQNLPGSKKSNITIELLDENGKTTMTWVFANAFPVKIVKAPAKATDKDIMIESIDFAHEGMTVKK